MRFNFATLTVSRMLPLCLIGAACVSAQSKWTPYTAEYSNSVTTTESDGKVSTHLTTGKEERSADGSLLTTVVEDGKVVRGTLWDAATGRITDINYVSRKGILARIAPRQHLGALSRQAPVGTQRIAGIMCVGYPMNSGDNAADTGTVWVDEQDDVIMKSEINDHSHGHTVVRTLEKITFVEPDPTHLHVPADVEVSEQHASSSPK